MVGVGAELRQPSLDTPCREAIWSGSSGPPGSLGWFDGIGFWLNEVLGEELSDPDDPRLTADERESLRMVADSTSCMANGDYGVIELPTIDPRSAIPPSANQGTLNLATLNHAPEELRAAFMTSFDFVDDVAWLQHELQLRRNVPVTLCTHHWPGQDGERQRMVEGFWSHFNDSVVHFPGMVGTDCSCSVHAKLLLLEFDDRLRVALTSANLTRKHWSFRSEIVWVQDFPRARIDGAANPTRGTPGQHALERTPPDISRLLHGGRFAQTLAHFVADLLVGASRRRSDAWLSKLAMFDFTGANAHLIASIPGFFCPARRAQPGELALRLTARSHLDDDEAAAEPSDEQIRRIGLLHRRRLRGWELRRSSPGEAVTAAWGTFNAASSEALDAAVALGLSVRYEVEVLPTGSKEVKKWDAPVYDDPEASSLLGSIKRGAQHIAWHLLNGIFSGAGLWGAQAQPSLEVRVVLEGTCNAPWARGVPSLLSRMDVNYGLFALSEHLSEEIWLQTEEQHYVAISGSITTPHERWFESMDRLIGRSIQGETAGPSVVAPGGTWPIDASYAEYDKRGKLVEHFSPWHAPGRDLVPNHGKVIVRQFWDARSKSPYGWAYAGSHNLTKAAWGDVIQEEPLCERLWVANRELGVLFVQPRATSRRASDQGDSKNLFSRLALPFGLPLLPADLSERDLIQSWEWWKPDDAQDWGYQDWQPWYEDSSDDEMSESDTEGLDWKSRTSSWWWHAS